MSEQSQAVERTWTVAPSPRRESISVVFRSPKAFARSREEGAPVDGIFLPRPDLEVGQEVDLEIAFADSGVVFRGPGIVLWRRLSGSKQMRPGVGLEFAPGDPSRRLLLFQFAEGRSPRPLVSRPRRIASRIAVEYATVDQGRRWTTITNLSTAGAFLQGAGHLRPGALVHLELSRPSARPIRITAVVAWSRPGIGAGVRFMPTDEAVRLSMGNLAEPDPPAPSGSGERRLMSIETGIGETP
jgi:PilZ domain-containing protein